MAQRASVEEQGEAFRRPDKSGQGFEMKLYVDSSVIAKLFIEEKESEGAIKLMKLSGKAK